MEDEERLDTTESVLERMREEPLVGEFAIPLPALSGSSEGDIGSAVKRLSELIGPSKREATITFNIADAGEARVWTVKTGPDGSSVTSEGSQSPDLELIMSRDTWSKIASSALSPLEAFGRGEMRVIGEIRVARRVVRSLQRST